MTDETPRIPDREIPDDTWGPMGDMGPGTITIDGKPARRRWMIQGYGPKIRRQTRYRFTWIPDGEVPGGAWHEWENPTEPGRNPILHVAAWSWIAAVEEYKRRWHERFGMTNADALGADELAELGRADEYRLDADDKGDDHSDYRPEWRQ